MFTFTGIPEAINPAPFRAEILDSPQDSEDFNDRKAERMTIKIEPHPEYPNGGWAVMSVDGAAGAGSLLSIYDPSREKWLGPDGWQSAETPIVPHAAGQDAGGSARLVLGPKIVDEIQPNAALEIRYGEAKELLAWPDTIRQSPATADNDRGGIDVAGPDATPPEPKPPMPKPPAKPQIPEEPVFDPDAPRVYEPPLDGYPPQRHGNHPYPAPTLGIFSILLLILIALAIWFLFVRDSGPDESAGDDTPALSCDDDGFASRAGETIDDQVAALESCGDEVSGESRLRVLEAGARAENARALLLLGELYDPGVETAGQPVFSRSDPAIAAEYYFRALDAGSIEAAGRLEAVCGILDPNDPLQEFNRSQYCGE